MTRTTPTTLVILLAVGALGGWLVELLLTQNARPLLTPPIVFSAILIVVAVGVVLIAVPVRRVARGRPGARIDPFLAARVAVFAQAAALTAAVLLGATAAVLGYLLTRPVIGEGLLWPSILAVVAAAVLLAAALIAEEMCRIPPGEDGPEEDPIG